MQRGFRQGHPYQEGSSAEAGGRRGAAEGGRDQKSLKSSFSARANALRNTDQLKGLILTPPGLPLALKNAPAGSSGV